MESSERQMGHWSEGGGADMERGVAAHSGMEAGEAEIEAEIEGGSTDADGSLAPNDDHQ